jgi:hypothetical protein
MAIHSGGGLMATGRQRTRLGPIIVSVVVVIVIVGAVGLLIANHHHGQKPSAGTEPPGTSVPPGKQTTITEVDHLQLGATLTQQTSLTETLPATLLNGSVSYLNISLGDDGTSDPEPSPGVFDWSSLDARMRQLAPLNTQIVLRAFDAPGWMTASGQAKTAPLPKYYQSFANLVLATVQRYPQIKFVVVWNELKGFRQNANNWNYQAYTTLYNTVYTTVKASDPSVEIGGPYVPFPPASPGETPSSLTGPWGAVSQNSLNGITYWIKHAVGADFLAIDGRTAQPLAIPSQPAASTELFSTVDTWLQQQTKLPIWWMEWYARSPKLGAPEWDAISAYALMQMAASGASNAFIWDPEFRVAGASTATPGIWASGTDTGTSLTPVFQVLKTKLYGSRVSLTSHQGVEVLSNGSTYLAVSTVAQTRSIAVDGSKLKLSPYAITSGQLR